jgi:RNA polymerase-interacting CarD/CdnL/TRCF family regulator
MLSLNDIRKVAFVIKKYWKEQRKKRLEFTKVKRDLLEKAIDLISEEIAFVTQTSLVNTKLKIARVLNGSFKDIASKN